ncbi:MAG TPA: inorganic diphosphatase [Acidimicrobiales bacterium]|nr:inorganic diphosphatase [Acidimicrobiales bacterium]
MSSIGHKPGPGSPTRVEVIIEIPRDSRNKYEIDDDSGAVWLDRTLFTATRYPANYGFIPGTLAGDGDPIDVLVLMDEAVFPGVHVWARPIGVLEMRDEAGPDAKVLAVPFGDPRWDHLQDLTDIPALLRAEIDHFFEVYKALEPGKSTERSEWRDRARAHALIEEAQQAALA